MMWVVKVTEMNCDRKKIPLITEGPLMMKSCIGSCISTSICTLDKYAVSETRVYSHFLDLPPWS